MAQNKRGAIMHNKQTEYVNMCKVTNNWVKNNSHNNAHISTTLYILENVEHWGCLIHNCLIIVTFRNSPLISLKTIQEWV